MDFVAFDPGFVIFKFRPFPILLADPDQLLNMSAWKATIPFALAAV